MRAHSVTIMTYIWKGIIITTIGIILYFLVMIVVSDILNDVAARKDKEFRSKTTWIERHLQESKGIHRDIDVSVRLLSPVLQEDQTTIRVFIHAQEWVVVDPSTNLCVSSDGGGTEDFQKVKNRIQKQSDFSKFHVYYIKSPRP